MRSVANQKRESLINSLSTVFVIVYLQEAAWIVAPLLISANVLLHSFLRDVGEERLLYIAAFSFFVITAITTVIGLWLIQHRALARLQQKYLLPYFITKVTRMCVLLLVATWIVIDEERRKWYFYASLYGVFESLAGLVALEIVYRSWKYLRKARTDRRPAGTLTETKESDVLWRPNASKSFSIRSCASVP